MADSHFAQFNYLCSQAETDLLKKISLPLNHCNVPSWLLASTAYQANPIPLEIDGTHVWYSALFSALKRAGDNKTRLKCFNDFMAVYFRLGKSEQIEEEYSEPTPRPKVNYRRLLLGWLFDSDNEQGAAWRSWVESRFGLLTCYHRESLYGPDTSEYLRFRQVCTRAIYNTNELYAQLDLLYCFCQYELRLKYNSEHITLYRGCSEIPEYVINGDNIKLFNNLSSFTADPESALRFGSKIFSVQVPLAKIACFESLLPHSLQGEQEFMVLGGLYKVERWRG